MLSTSAELGASLQVPMEKIFNKSLLSKFHWAMEVEPDFKF